MKNLHTIPLLLSSILLASSALAQNSNAFDTSLPADSGLVEVARGPYVRPENNPFSVNNSTGEENKTLAQFPQRPPSPLYPPPQMRPPRGSYPGMWSSPVGDHHTAVGALIGFGVGATAGALIGASKADSSNRGATALIGSLLFGGLGAPFGAAVASFPSPQFHRYRPWEDEGYDQLGSRHKHHSPNREVSNREVSSREVSSARAPNRTPDRQAALAGIPDAP